MGGLMEESRKKIIRKVSVAFLMLILFFTFFSNTINNLSLPVVTVEKPTSGSLIKELSASGKISEREIIEIYADANRKVNEVKVDVGDSVKKGQELIILDSASIMNTLKDENNKLEQKKLNLSKLKEAGGKSALLSTDKNIELARQKYEEAKEEYDEVMDRYNYGQASPDMVKNAENNFKNAKADYDIAKNSKEKSLKDNEREINSLMLDIEMQERKIEDLNQSISRSIITAEEDGIVSEVNVTKNSTTSISKASVKLSTTSKGYSLNLTVDNEEADLVKEEMEVNILLEDKRTTVKGKVEVIKDNEQFKGVKKDIKIGLNAEGVSIGDSASINITSKTKPYMTLLPNEAVHEGNDGYYIYIIREKKGPLGDQYLVQKVMISYEDYDDSKCAVTSGVMLMDKVVTTSDKSLSDGNQVRLQN
jgi:multidrug efflux pump subunit AcrA (membrane-fusion protein)